MIGTKDPRILLFLASSEPTAAETLLFLELGNNCVMRNGSVGTGGSAPEQCDGVSALPNEEGVLPIPPEYLRKKSPDGKSEIDMPDGKAVIKAHREGTKARLTAVAAEAKAAKPASVGKQAVAPVPAPAAPVAAAQWTPNK
jgi:hypothetical protein